MDNSCHHLPITSMISSSIKERNESVCGGQINSGGAPLEGVRCRTRPLCLAWVWFASPPFRKPGGSKQWLKGSAIYNPNSVSFRFPRHPSATNSSRHAYCFSQSRSMSPGSLRPDLQVRKCRESRFEFPRQLCAGCVQAELLVYQHVESRLVLVNLVLQPTA